MALARLAGLALSVLVPCGCSELAEDDGAPDLDWPVRQLDLRQQSDQFTVLLPRAVDVLFVVEGASTMGDIQRRLGDDVAPLFSALDLGELDYHVGVVSTDPAEGGRLRDLDGLRVLDRDTADAADRFAELAAVGTDGPEEGSGRDVVVEALADPPHPWNAGFRRPGAALYLVVVSDGDDASALPIDDFVDWLGTLVAARGGVRFTSVVSADPVCPEARRPGLGYLEVTARAGGLARSVCDRDWRPIHEAIARDLVGSRGEFFLTRLPVPETLRVRVVEDHFTDSLLPGVEWTYDPVGNAVRIVRRLPDAGAGVQIGYEVRPASY